MRFLSWLVTLPIPVIVVIFALQNREQVELSFWPFDVEIAMPLSFLAVGLVATGIVVGVLFMQFSVLKLWNKKRKLEKTIKNLQSQLSTEKAKAAESSEPTILHQGRYQMISDVSDK